jgi:tripartite-type tricarboxylate transporter receptor subunit TctC
VYALRLACLLLISTLCALPATALAQAYPSKPIRILLAFAPGGGTDLLARTVGQKLQEKWGQPVIVENRPGAGGVIAGRAAATSAPDGYTLYMASSDHMVLAPHLFDGLPYDTAKDFVPVIPVANQPLVLVVHPSVPAQNLKEFVAFARSKPGELNFSSPGTGGINHLTGELLMKAAGIKMVHVPFKGSAPATSELLSGREVTVSFATMGSITPHIRSGKVRALALSTPQRSKALPDVPTIAEQGYAGFATYSWNGLFAPAGTPADVVAKLNAEIAAILKAPDVIERLSSIGVEPTGSPVGEFSSFFKEDLEKWGKVIREAGIKKEKL